MPELSPVLGATTSSSIRTGEEEVPRIAIAIIARNAEDFLAECLESIATQTDLPDEVIVYDDGSEDSTSTVAREFEDRIPNLVVLGDSKPAGLAAARNRANAAATADYIAVLDADDLFEEGAIRSYREFVRAHPGIDLVYADTLTFASDPGSNRRLRYPRFRSREAGMRAALAAPRLPFKHSSLLYRRAALEELGGYDESYRLKIDIELFLRFLAAERSFAKLDAPVSFHRRHRGQVSTRRIEGLKAYARLVRAYEPRLLLRGPLFAIRSAAELAKLLLRQ